MTAAATVVRRESPIGLWDQWDARWYLGIASHGYHWSIGGKSALAFFPLYPLLIKAGSALYVPSLPTAIVISNLAFAGALFYLYRFVEIDAGEPTASRALLLFAVFPGALFTFGPYSESLFLLCALGAVVHAHRGQALTAGAWAAGALLTRSVGVAVVVAVLAYLWQRPVRDRLLATVPSVVAGIAYAGYLASLALPLSALLTAQRSWHRGLGPPWIGFTSSLQWLGRHAATNPPWAAENLLSLALTILFLGLTVLAWRTLDTPMRLYCAGFWVIVLSSPEWLDGYYAPFSSMIRFVLALFPLAGWAACRLTDRWYRAYLVGSSALLAGATGVYLAGGWVG